jgi:hypothetical protein
MSEYSNLGLCGTFLLNHFTSTYYILGAKGLLDDHVLEESSDHVGKYLEER